MPDFSRRQNRLNNYDYSTDGDYFVTICTADKKCTLGWITPNTSAVHLSANGRIVHGVLQHLPTVFPCASIPDYVIMPNHIHLIVRLKESPYPLSYIINWLKGSVSKAAGAGIWQKSFYDHIIRNDDDYSRIIEYIQHNPIAWSSDIYFITEETEPPAYL